MKKASKQMKTIKATGPNDIPIVAWKCLGKVEEIWITRLSNTILMTKKMLNE